MVVWLIEGTVLHRVVAGTEEVIKYSVQVRATA